MITAPTAVGAFDIGLTLIEAEVIDELARLPA